MRGLILALSILFVSTMLLISPPARCRGADAGGSAAAPPSAAADPSDPIVSSLCHIACGDLPCCCHGVGHPGHDIAARLNAIDCIGGFKTYAAVKCLRGLLCELCAQCGKEHCGCADLDRTLLALHAIQALGNIGAIASPALPEMSAAACISSDLGTAIQTASTTIQKPPAATAPPKTVDAATKAALDKAIGQLKHAREALHHQDLPWADELIGKLLDELKKLETPAGQ
jgi:hypothetical protein